MYRRYHGWTFALDGRLTKATKLQGIEDFKARDYGLVPIRVETWGPFVLALLGSHTGLATDLPPAVEPWLGDGGKAMVAAGVHDALRFVRRRVYELHCNWKVNHQRA